MAATALPGTPAAGQAAGGDMLALWAEATGRRRPAGPGLGGLRSAFCGRVSTEDWLDPVTLRARQREQAAVLVAGHGDVFAVWSATWPVMAGAAGAGHLLPHADHTRGCRRQRQQCPAGARQLTAAGGHFRS